ncbi:MAG: hypothetical protein K8L97_09800 [Anaerolineae bacterium]|nr:hypothetical protein [Anaerolineae bacterium]
MGNLQQDAIAAKHNLIALPFQAPNIPDANVTAVTIQIDNPDYLMPTGGSVVGLSARHNADLTGGVITWTPTINGVAASGLAAVTDDTNQQAYAKQAARVVNFKAGDRLGVLGSKTGTVAPTTTDAVLVLLVLLDGLDF